MEEQDDDGDIDDKELIKREGCGEVLGEDGMDSENEDYRSHVMRRIRLKMRYLMSKHELQRFTINAMLVDRWRVERFSKNTIGVYLPLHKGLVSLY